MAPQSLARRLLFPHSAVVPPLLATSDVPHDLHAELYDLIALSLRAYLNPWWTRITRYDKDFLPHTAQLLTVVIRALESRILALDLPALVFCDVPNVITQHYRDYRYAEAKLVAGDVASLPLLFHHLQPHIALSSDGTLDREYYRQIVDRVLRVCLPPEDYAPDAERAIICEVLVKILVDHVILKIAHPWFMQSMILDLLAHFSHYQVFFFSSHSSDLSFPSSSCSPPNRPHKPLPIHSPFTPLSSSSSLLSSPSQAPVSR